MKASHTHTHTHNTHTQHTHTHTSHSVGSTLPTGQLTNIPWRRQGVKYANNEVTFKCKHVSIAKPDTV